MDDKQKAKLAAKLSGDPKFDSTYTPENRLWFARAVVDAVAAAKPDAEVEAEAKRRMSESHKRVAADREFTVGVTLDPDFAPFERKDVARRVETIYGVIARSTELAETGMNSLRMFLVKRRYRSVVRMVYQVNPNLNGFFVYPGTCPGPPPPGRTKWRTNIDTKNLWERTGPGMVPLRVKVPQGAADPKTAAEKLWIAHLDPCESNLFDCAHAVSCVLMDTLFEAADTDKLLKSVYARRPDHFLIVHPMMFKDTHYLWEPAFEPKRLFSKEQVPPADLQVGDHVYIWNHGLYPQLDPFGFWSGEHALVANCGNRKFADGKGFLFSGHGLNDAQTVEALHDELIKDLQTRLHRTYAIASIFLKFRKSGDTSIPAAKFRKIVLQAPQPSGPPADVHCYEIEAPFSYVNYNAKPGRSGAPPMIFDTRFVAFDAPALKQIGIAVADIRTIAGQVAEGADMMTTLVRTTAPAAPGSIYDPGLWQIRYFDTDAGAPAFFPLFGGPRGAMQMLDRKQMPKFKFGRLAPTDTGALTTRPTSDPSATYVTFLRANGAIT